MDGFVAEELIDDKRKIQVKFLVNILSHAHGNKVAQAFQKILFGKPHPRIEKSGVRHDRL